MGNNLLLLLSEISVIKTEALPERPKREYQENVRADDGHTNAAASGSVKMVAHVDEVHLLQQKIAPQCQTLPS